MRKALLVALLTGPLLAACSYRPEPVEQVRVWDSPVDLNACRRLRRVAGPVATGPGFEITFDAMRQATLAAGGTDLYLRRSGRDNAFVVADAYRCPPKYSGFALR